MAYSSLSVANTFLDFAHEESKALTNMKLQKLLYFAEGHHLAHRKRQLMDEEPLAWQFGPVYRSVYNSFKYCGSDPIQSFALDDFPDEDGEFTYSTVEDERDRSFLRSVWNAYRDHSAGELSAMSHVKDGPWDRARKLGDSQQIPHASIADYFMSIKSRAGNSSQAA